MSAQTRGILEFAVLGPGDEAIAALEALASRNGIKAASFVAIGAFSSATLGYFDRQSRSYERLPYAEQVEVCSLVGNIAWLDAKPKVHAHCVIGLRDGSTRGGHLLEGHVWPTLEVRLEILATELVRLQVPEIGLALLEL